MTIKQKTATYSWRIHPLKAFPFEMDFAQKLVLYSSLQCAFLVATFRTLPTPLYVCFIQLSSCSAVFLWPKNFIKPTDGIKGTDKSSLSLGARTIEPTFRIFFSEWGLRICIYTRFPSDADAPRSTSGEPLINLTADLFCALFFSSSQSFFLHLVF